jgi:hypothetical protein
MAIGVKMDRSSWYKIMMYGRNVVLKLISGTMMVA